MKRLRWLLGAMLLVFAVTVAACGDDEGSGGGGGGGGGEPIKVGTSLPLTGEFSEPGKAAKQGYESGSPDEREGRAARSRRPDVVKDDASNRTRSSPTTTR